MLSAAGGVGGFAMSGSRAAAAGGEASCGNTGYISVLPPPTYEEATSAEATVFLPQLTPTTIADQPSHQPPEYITVCLPPLNDPITTTTSVAATDDSATSGTPSDITATPVWQVRRNQCSKPSDQSGVEYY